MIPIIGTSAAISPPFFKPRRRQSARPRSTPTSTPTTWSWSQRSRVPGVLGRAAGQQGKVPGAQTGDFTTYFTAPGAVHLYDGMNLAALAMVAAHSTDTAKWQPYLISIGDGVPGAVTVNSFAQGVKELNAGKKIRYVGPGGPTSFDAFHDSPGIFQIDTYSPTGAVVVSGSISAAQLRAVSG